MTILASDNSRTFAFSEAIADAIGSYEAAIVLQQIHYYIEQGNSGRIFDGVRWIYNSYRTWCREFKLFKPGKVRQLINLLREFELIRVEQLTKNHDDKNCFWYTVDYERVNHLLSQSSNQNASKPYSTGCVPQNTTPVEDESGRVLGEKSSIYTKKTNQREHPEENNSPDAADSSVCESENDFFEASQYEEQTGIPSFVNKEENQVTGDKSNCPKDKDSVSARDNNNLRLLEVYGFELNKQLEKLAHKYSEKEIKRSLEFLDECEDAGQEIQKPLGWLTECLKGEWWHNSFKSLEEQAVIDGLLEQGKKLNDPEGFFGTLWQMVDQGYITAMPEEAAFGIQLPGLMIDGQLGSFVQFTDGNFYVNWYDESYQQKLNLGIFQTMPWSEALKRFQEESA